MRSNLYLNSSSKKLYVTVVFSILPKLEFTSTLLLDKDVNAMLDVLQDEVITREVGLASNGVEVACFVLYPRFRTCWAVVCRSKGGLF